MRAGDTPTSPVRPARVWASCTERGPRQAPGPGSAPRRTREAPRASPPPQRRNRVAAVAGDGRRLRVQPIHARSEPSSRPSSMPCRQAGHRRGRASCHASYAHRAMSRPGLALSRGTDALPTCASGTSRKDSALRSPSRADVFGCDTFFRKCDTKGLPVYHTVLHSLRT